MTVRGPRVGKTIRHRLFAAALWRCQNCHRVCPEIHNRVLVTDRYLTIDHIVPTSQGGANAPWNMAVLCNVCNVKKGDHTWRALFAPIVSP